MQIRKLVGAGLGGLFNLVQATDRYAREVTDDELWRVHVVSGNAEPLDLTDVERFEFSPTESCWPARGLE